MTLSTSNARKNLVVWLFGSLGFYLVLEAGIFLLVGTALAKSARALAGPYVAFALPGATILSLVWWLHRSEKRGSPPRRLARGWGMSVAVCCVMVMGAASYSGVALGFESPGTAIGGGVAGALLGAFITYLTMYHMALARISSRGQTNTR